MYWSGWWALFVFKEHENAGPEEKWEVCYVKIWPVIRLKMVLGFVTKGASFWSASQFVDIFRQATKLSDLRDCSEKDCCATAVRIICAGSLKRIYELLPDCWAYSIAMDVGHTHKGRRIWMSECTFAPMMV